MGLDIVMKILKIYVLGTLIILGEYKLQKLPRFQVVIQPEYQSYNVRIWQKIKGPNSHEFGKHHATMNGI